MRGVTVAKPGSPFEVVENLTRPSPGDNELLIKPLVAGLNPMEGFMQQGLLVEEWPIVLGCEASGVVVEAGKNVKNFQVGDKVFGPVRIGFPGYMVFQEFYLLPESLAFAVPKKLSLEETAGISIAAVTAALGLGPGLGLTIPEPGTVLENKPEWIIILGGAGAIGQMSVQIAKLNGYKVLTSNSPANDQLLKSLGADATFDYKQALDTQIATITSLTRGNFSKVYDTSSAATETGFQALLQSSIATGEKIFASTDDWTLWDERAGVSTYRLELGQLGRDGSEASANPRTAVINTAVEQLIPKLGRLFTSGDLKPVAHVVGGTGFEGVLDGLKLLNAGGARGKKIVVKLQEA